MLVAQHREQVKSSNGPGEMVLQVGREGVIAHWNLQQSGAVPARKMIAAIIAASNRAGTASHLVTAGRADAGMVGGMAGRAREREAEPPL
jgi:hypothetical protein